MNYTPDQLRRAAEWQQERADMAPHNSQVKLQALELSAQLQQAAANLEALTELQREVQSLRDKCAHRERCLAQGEALIDILDKGYAPLEARFDELQGKAAEWEKDAKRWQAIRTKRRSQDELEKRGAWLHVALSRNDGTGSVFYEEAADSAADTLARLMQQDAAMSAPQPDEVK